MGSSFIGYGIIMLIILFAGQAWLKRTGRSQEFWDSLVITIWGGFHSKFMLSVLTDFLYYRIYKHMYSLQSPSSGRCTGLVLTSLPISYGAQVGSGMGT